MVMYCSRLCSCGYTYDPHATYISRYTLEYPEASTRPIADITTLFSSEPRFLIENGISMKPQCLDQDRERFRHFALQAAASTK